MQKRPDIFFVVGDGHEGPETVKALHKGLSPLGEEVMATHQSRVEQTQKTGWRGLFGK